MTNPIYDALANWRRAATVSAVMTEMEIVRRFHQTERPKESELLNHINSRIEEADIPAHHIETSTRRDGEDWVLRVVYDVPARFVEDFEELAKEVSDDDEELDKT